MLTLLRWCALRTARFAAYVEDRSYDVVSWCNHRYELQRWRKWDADNPGYDTPKAWLMVKPVVLTGNKLDPKDLGMPHCVAPRPWKYEIEAAEGNDV